MISKYNGTCRYCKQATKAGVDEYDLETKTGFHPRCKEQDDERISPDAEALAIQLGYAHYPWERLYALLEPSGDGSPRASDLVENISANRGKQSY